MANFADYQNAANSIYDPQQQAEAAQLTTTRDTNIASSEAQKGQINTDYNSAIQNLTQSTNKEVGNINQLYTLRLGGNFSGLQGNDLGDLFSRSNQTQANIEETRANKLNIINTDENNIRQNFNTAFNGLGSKYSSLKAQYANGAYADAVKQEQDQAYKQAQLNLSYARLAQSSAPKAPTTADLRNNLQADIANAFNDRKGSSVKGYTEKTLLPLLYQTYGALGNDEINKAVYQYRKARFG